MLGIKQVVGGRTGAGLTGGQATARAQVVGRDGRAGERPLALVPPVSADENAAFGRLVRVAAAHHKDANGRVAIHAVVETLEPVIEPAELEGGEIERRLRPELRLAGVAERLAAV